MNHFCCSYAIHCSSRSQFRITSTTADQSFHILLSNNALPPSLLGGSALNWTSTSNSQFYPFNCLIDGSISDILSLNVEMMKTSIQIHNCFIRRRCLIKELSLSLGRHVFVIDCHHHQERSCHT